MHRTILYIRYICFPILRIAISIHVFVWFFFSIRYYFVHQNKLEPEFLICIYRVISLSLTQWTSCSHCVCLWIIVCVKTVYETFLNLNQKRIRSCKTNEIYLFTWNSWKFVDKKLFLCLHSCACCMDEFHVEFNLYWYKLNADAIATVVAIHSNFSSIPFHRILLFSLTFLSVPIKVYFSSIYAHT